MIYRLFLSKWPAKYFGRFIKPSTSPINPMVDKLRAICFRKIGISVIYLCSGQMLYLSLGVKYACSLSTPSDLKQVSKFWGSALSLSNRSENWQALRQHSCWGACPISERYEDLNYQYAGFEISRVCCGLEIRRPGTYRRLCASCSNSSALAVELLQ